MLSENHQESLVPVTTVGASRTPAPPVVHGLWAGSAGLTFAVAEPGERVLDVHLDGRRVWSFRESDHAVPPGCAPVEGYDGALRFAPWPDALVPWLRGTFSVSLVPVDGSPERWPSVRVSLDDDPRPLSLADRFGRPLVVNKWGRLGHALADAGPAMVERMLDSADRIRELLEAHLGPRVYVTGGTLLGPVREGGRLLPHDDDADLAYLSRHSDPADVALESFEVGRLLRAAGHEVVRLSVGPLQVHVDHEGAPDHYVDVFPGFLLEGRWYQHFAIRTEAGVEDLLPPTTVLVEGRPQPAPRDPERMLHELFGPGWAVPDPAYTFDIPAETADRFYGWFADYNVEREDWEDEVALAPPRSGGAPVASAFARWVDEQTPAGGALLELGCGLGRDALALAAAGRHVRAVDFSRYAVAELRAQLAEQDLDLEVEVLNLLDTRAAVRLGARAAARPGTWSVFGRRLLNAVEDRGRDNVFRLCGMLLRRGGAAHFDLVTDHGYAGIAPHRHLSLDQIVREAARYGLVLDEAIPCSEPLRWAGAPGEQLVDMVRTTFRRRTR